MYTVPASASADSISTRILARMRGSDQVFTSKDFLDLGGRAAVDQALSRLVKERMLCRPGRGLYCLPRPNGRLAGILVPPEADAIAAALARKSGGRVVPSGATAANRLGLSTQVPAQAVYLTDGPSRKVQVGKRLFELRHVPPKELPFGNPLAALVIQALRSVGREAVDATTVEQLRRRLPPAERASLAKVAGRTTEWIGDILCQLAEADPNG